MVRHLFSLDCELFRSFLKFCSMIQSKRDCPECAPCLIRDHLSRYAESFFSLMTLLFPVWTNTRLNVLSGINEGFLCMLDDIYECFKDTKYGDYFEKKHQLLEGLISLKNIAKLIEYSKKSLSIFFFAFEMT